MKTIELTIKGLPPCPRNRSHVIIRKGKTAFMGKTEAARSYEKAIKKHLLPFEDQIMVFRESFDKDKHALEAEWIFRTPDLYTASGKISENSVDLDAHKVLQDVIMEAAGVDDAYITSDYRVKVHNQQHEVIVRLTIVEK